MDYLTIKTLHILSSTLLFGTGLGSAYYALRAWLTRDVNTINHTFRHLVFADWAFTATMAVFQPLSGWWMMRMAGFTFQQPWIFWAIILYCIAGAAWLPVVWLQIRIHRLATIAQRDNTPLPAQAGRYMLCWFILGWPAFIAFIIIFYLMTAKPQWPVPF